MSININMNLILNILEIMIFLVCVLFTVAYLTVAERKTMGYMQRRIGPNIVGYYGLLQAFADAIKLLIKEILIPKESNKIIFIISPLITLTTALLGWLVIPFGPSLTIGDIDNGILYTLAISSLGVLGSLLAGWGSNNKWSLLGSIRSTATLISYELILTTCYIIILMLVSSLNYTILIETQRIIWYSIPLLPITILFYISTVAETNRPPFDLIEAENELVAGFFTEYSASPFVFFFLAEYSNLLIMSAASIILFFGGYLLPNFNLFHLNYNSYLSLFDGLYYGFSFGLKLCIFTYIFIWIRASFPRFTFDLLIKLCWTIFLPILFGLFLFIPSLFYLFNSFTLNLL
jgi:NADH-ubiquinone oxidoreductase chain 1